MRSWGNHMVHHAIYYKQNYSYFGIIEALSGAPFDVSFISFDDIRANRDTAEKVLMLSLMWEMQILHRQAVKTGSMKQIITAVREFVYNGGGFIGVGEPAAHQWQGKFIPAG